MALRPGAWKVRSIVLGLGIAGLLVYACSRSASDGGAYYEAPPPPPGSPAPVQAMAPMEDARAIGGLSGKGGGGRAGHVDRPLAKPAKSAATKDEGAADPATIEPAKARMVHYDGSVSLRVTDTRKVLDQAAVMAVGMGGFVEQQNESMVMLRIPVEHIREAFNQMLGLGDVLSKSLSASDITDAFTATELRLKTMRASRDRLIALLATVRDESERLEILGEIRRLTEEIDGLDLQVKTLAKLAAYSRLTLQVQPRETRGTTKADALAAFRWIDDLSAFRRDTAQRGTLFKLAAPAEMVVLDASSHWIAESADGAVVWTSKRDNSPRGTNDFWSSAIADRMGPDFASVTRSKIGAFDFVTFEDGGNTHYRYMVGVHANGDKLEVIEIYYPTPEHEKRYSTGVNAVIPGGAS